MSEFELFLWEQRINRKIKVILTLLVGIIVVSGLAVALWNMNA